MFCRSVFDFHYEIKMNSNLKILKNNLIYLEYISGKVHNILFLRDRYKIQNKVSRYILGTVL